MSEWIGCDRCSVAVACYQVKGIDGELYFCHHHFKEHESKLGEWAFEIIDLRVEATLEEESV